VGSDSLAGHYPLWAQTEVVPAERGTQPRKVSCRQEPTESPRPYDMLRAVEDRDADAGRIVPRAVQQPVRHIRVRPQCARPRLRAIVSPGEDSGRSADPGKTWPGEIDEPYWPSHLDAGQGAPAGPALPDRVQPWIPAERLDERPVERLRCVEHAVLLARVVEPILQGPSKEHRATPHAVNPKPWASSLNKREMTVSQIARRERRIMSRRHRA